MSITSSPSVFSSEAREIIRKKLARQIIPGQDYIPVTGKIIDEEDIILGLESVLDGWLTAGRFATQFERAFTESDKADLRLLIKQVGASNEMKPLLVALGIEPLPPTLPSHWYTCWRLEIEDPSDEIVVMLALIEASPDRRRVLLWSMLDPRSAAQNWRTIRTARTTVRAFTRARRRALAAR